MVAAPARALDVMHPSLSPGLHRIGNHVDHRTLTVEPGVPELTNELIDLGLVAAPARALDVMHPSPSPDSEQIGNHGVHRTLTELRRETELALHRPSGRRVAERGDLQPSDHCAPVSVGPSGLAVRCAASHPDLHPSQLARVATLELEASGCLTVEVGWKEVAGGRTSKTRNHHTLTPASEPWGSPHAYSQQPGVPISLKACKTRSLEGGNDDLAWVEKSPNFRYVTRGKLGFYAVSQLLDAT